jgi:protoporphyrinogen oxidase
MEDQVGGISRTIQYKGNRIDIGGHRFFSKVDSIMEWWQNILPVDSSDNAGNMHNVMLIRNRLSRIFYLRKFFDYPISLKWKTLKNLGLLRVFAIVAAYVFAAIFPRKPEKTLEDFFINRFGKSLYKTFFRDYTKKVWGVPCNEITAEWGAQRVKKLSIFRVLLHAVISVFSTKDDIKQKDTDTSLIERFLYPKFGPGQLWETVAGKIRENGGNVLLNHKVYGIDIAGGSIAAVRVMDTETGEKKIIPCIAAISSLPLRELLPMFSPPPAQRIQAICKGLVYRDFITVGLLVNKLLIQSRENNSSSQSLIKDNWIYIQDPDVHIGRIQIFNNWSPWLVNDVDKVWMGLEYFVSEGDSLWSMQNNNFIAMAIKELVYLGFIADNDVVDSTILHVKKAYPAYFGTYHEINIVQEYLDSIPNIYPVGRNGMHRYNNMDHSMLSAMQAVLCIINQSIDKKTIWNINEEQEYHETK